MSLINPGGAEPVLTRAADAEVLEAGPTTMWLLADSDATDGTINANRTALAEGADGPGPHYHSGSAEIFFVVSGGLDALAGDRIETLREGDFLVVPRNTPHAFAAPPGSAADVLIVFAPAIEERFEYFRLVDRVVRGQASPQEILDSQDRFDNHFLDVPIWKEHRSAGA